MKRKLSLTLVYFFSLFVIMSCGSYKEFYVECISRGSLSPVVQYNYCILEPSENYDILEWKEYVSELRPRLAELGYKEVSKEDANLYIIVDYYMGDKEIVSSTSSHSTYGIANSVTNLNSKTTSVGVASGSSIQIGNVSMSGVTGGSQSRTQTQMMNSQYYRGGGSTTTDYNGVYPFHFNVSGFSNDGTPMFALEMECVVDVPSKVSKVVPWLCLVAKWNVGRKYSGKIKVATPNFESYYLPQCFDSDYWKVQYDYFEGYDTYITSEPRR